MGAWAITSTKDWLHVKVHLPVELPISCIFCRGSGLFGGRRRVFFVFLTRYEVIIGVHVVVVVVVVVVDQIRIYVEEPPSFGGPLLSRLS